MKLVVVGAIAFAVGVAGGTVMSPARAPLPVDSTAAESHDAPEHAESETAPVPSPTASEEHAVEDPSHAPAADAAMPAEPASTDAAAEAAAMAKRIGELPPGEAGPMLARLEESEALAVLKRLSITKASEVLDAMPREQGARLSRLLLLEGSP